MVVFLLYSARVGYTDEKIRISELLSACIDLAERGGRRVIEVRKMSPNEMEQSSKGQTKEGAAEYVTLGDRDSHQIITSGLMSRWPHLPFRSEEKEMEILEVIPPRTFNAEVMGMANRNEEVRSLGRVVGMVWKNNDSGCVQYLRECYQYTLYSTNAEVMGMANRNEEVRSLGRVVGMVWVVGVYNTVDFLREC